MDILQIYQEKKEDVESSIRILGDLYHLHPRESAIRLASAGGELRIAVREYEMNPDSQVPDYNIWNCKNFDEIIDSIIDGSPALGYDDFIEPSYSSFQLPDVLNSTSSTISFIKKKKKSLVKRIISSKKKVAKDDCCGVCSETKVDWKTNCGHLYCEKCAKKWFEEQKKTSCPMCRQTVSVCNEV